jgi:hypothetical protein
MKLFELLDRKIPYTVLKETGSVFKTSAVINGRIIVFTAAEETPGVWDLEFSEKNKNNPVLTTYGSTGSGAELEVFSMIKDSILEFVQRYEPTSMVFTADVDGSARVALYDRLIKKFKLPGYEYKKSDSDKHSAFSFTKIKDGS